MILGANTYAQAKDYWPYADEQGEYGRKLNNLTKFVASLTLDEAPWGDFPSATVTRDPAATIRELIHGSHASPQAATVQPGLRPHVEDQMRRKVTDPEGTRGRLCNPA
jgi:hypothetical protein